MRERRWYPIRVLWEIPPLYMDEFYELLGRLPQRYRNIQMKDKRQLLDIRVKSEEDFVLLTFRNWSLLKSGIRGRHHLYRMQDGYAVPLSL